MHEKYRRHFITIIKVVTIERSLLEVKSKMKWLHKAAYVTAMTLVQTNICALADSNDFDLRSFEGTEQQHTVDTTANAQHEQGQTVVTTPTQQSAATQWSLNRQAAYSRAQSQAVNKRPSLPTTKTSVMAAGSFGYILPPTSLDSFVTNAAGLAENIYGDEGTDGLPPYQGFTEDHTIGAGIYNPFLTTGHASLLPSAWGYPN
jgi:hypothetical protein